MQSDLKSKLPNIYHYFIQEQRRFKSEHDEHDPGFPAAWNALIGKQEQIVKTTIVFIKIIDSKIVKKEFVKEIYEKGSSEFNFPPALVKLVDSETLFEAIFDDTLLQNRRIFDRHEIDDALEYDWELALLPHPHMLFIIKKINDQLIVDTGIKEYQEAKKKLAAQPAPKTQQPTLSPEDRFRKYANELFESNRIFEKEVLQVTTKSDKNFLMKQIFKEIVTNTDAKNKLNFSYMESYDNFKIGNIRTYIIRVLREEVDYFLRNIPNMPQDVVEEVLASKKSFEFLDSLAQTYESKYGEMIMDVIADTFLECAASAETMTAIPGIIQEAINGTRQYKPILEITKGNSVATRADQLWMRVRQAKVEREKNLSDERKNVEYYEKKVNGIQKNIVALRKAFNLNVAAVKKFTPQMLVDIALNEDGTHTEEKRVLQFAPKGDVAMELIDLCDRARRGAKTGMQKEDAKKALKFYENLNVNNTENVLKAKLKEYTDELPQFQEKLEKALSKLEDKEDLGLEYYDEPLKAMKKALLENLGKRRI